MKISYEGRNFRAISNSGTGEVSSATIFNYHQEENIVWAEYHGGDILRGQLIARALEDSSLDMRYQHINKKGELMIGRCSSIPEILPDGRIRLHESWQWECGDFSKGVSMIEEIAA